MELTDLKMYNHLLTSNPTLASQIRQLHKITLETINGIAKSFNNFTMHDMNHGLRVATYMEQLAFGIDSSFSDRISKFNDLEIALMIACAILHDIGMTIREEDKQAIKSNNIKYSDSLTFDGVLKVVNNDKEEAIKEIIRRTHAARIHEFISYNFGGLSIENILLLDDNYSYADDVAIICQAHGEEHNFLESLRTERTKGVYTYNPRYIAALLRIADYLDLDKQRTPMLWFSIMEISGYSKEEWEKHFIIHNGSKLKDYIDGKLQIYFDGKSANAKIHRKYLRYIDDLKLELENTDELLNTKTTPEKYRFNICTKIDDRVQTEGFTYSDLRLTLDYSAITNLLMGRNIYGDCRLGLRELIQNAIDSCELMKEIGQTNKDVVIVEPSITVSYSQKEGYVKIRDTGIGMSLDIVKKHFLNVGKSYYKSNDFLFKNQAYKPIGQYGIGFLACFLLSDCVTVKTKHYSNHEINQIELEKDSEYVVTTSQETPNFLGTEIKLDYEKFFSVFKDEEDLKKFLECFFYTKVAIKLSNDDNDEPTIVIKNRCFENMSAQLENLNKSKFTYLTVDCETYSDLISGKLAIITESHGSKMSVSDIDTSSSFVFHAGDNPVFEPISDISQLNNKKYRRITYSNISSEEFNEIKEKEHTDTERFTKAIISYSKEQGKALNLFVNPDDYNKFFLDVYYSNHDNDDIDTSIVKQVFANSNIEFHKDLLSIFYNPSSIVFVHDGKIIDMYFASIDNYRSNRMIRYGIDDSLYNLSSTLYYKGILVPNFLSSTYIVPINVNELQGHIMCNNLPIKLDVSRNSIIEGKKELKKELGLIILKALKDNSDHPDVYDALIENLENQSIT